MSRRSDHWIVIPAYNEARHIKEVLKRCKQVQGRGREKDIVVVDDGSKDDTARLARAAGVTVLQHVVNLGKGAALKTGCDYAHQRQGWPIVVMDADGQHDPSETPSFLKLLETVDVVLSYRRKNRHMPVLMRIGNAFIDLVFKLIYGIAVKDSQSGYRAFRWDAYPLIRWDANDYSMESEMIARMAKRRLKFAQTMIPTVYQDKYKGTTVFDGIKIVTDLIWWKLTKL
ncbi:MAG: glycosyltransferase family 2 protein [DPANN group archaeon]|nr:glycosyltransferase family 2 protein [DPANN group archaeon]